MDESYCFYVEIELDTGGYDFSSTEYVMCSIPVELAFNTRYLISLVLIHFCVNQNEIGIEELVFISSNGISWVLKHDENGPLFFENMVFHKRIYISDYFNLPEIRSVFWQGSCFFIQRMIFLTQEHFQALRGMYTPNFDVHV